MKADASTVLANKAVMASVCRPLCQQPKLIGQPAATGKFSGLAQRLRRGPGHLLAFLVLFLELSAAQAQSGDFQRLLHSRVQAEQHGEWKQAIELGHRILQLKPQDIETMVSLSGLYGHAGNPDQQILWSQKVLVIQPGNFNALINRGNGYAAIGADRQAMDSYRAAEAVDPGSSIPAYSMGVLAQDRGRDSAAAGYFRKALQLSPRFEDARFNLAVSLANQGEAAQALKVLDQLLQQNPSASDAIQLRRALRNRDRR